MNKKCENCIKNDVCKYLEDFDNYVKNKEEEKQEEFIEVDVRCKFMRHVIENVPWVNPNEILFRQPCYTDDKTIPYDKYIITYSGSSTGKTDGDNINLK